jgi:L-alanine-DL-glutamate epimerase-like enolase superfamily enzyme
MMKITDVEPLLLTVPQKWEHGIRPSTFGFVRIKTDSGLTGLGESYVTWYVPEIVPPLVEHFGNVVIGEDPFNINALREKMFVKSLRWGPVGPGISVLGAIEIALWDILGKALEKPVYQLLGGAVHDCLRCYSSMAKPDQALADKLLTAGYSAIKVNHTGGMSHFDHISTPTLIARECEKVESMKKILGDEVDLMLDPALTFHRQPWSVDTAVQVIKALDPYYLLWFEQPSQQTHVDDYVRIRQATSTPLAAGESCTTLHEVKPFFEKRAIDICQPDASWCGGIAEAMKIMAAAEAHDMRVVPHSFSGAAGIAANYHVAFANRSCFMAPFHFKENPLASGLIKEAFTFKNGYLTPTGRPGLGVELTDEIIKKYPYVKNSGISHGRSPFPRPAPRDWEPAPKDVAAW